MHANLQPYQRENPTPSRLAYPATKGGELLEHLGGTTRIDRFGGNLQPRHGIGSDSRALKGQRRTQQQRIAMTTAVLAAQHGTQGGGIDRGITASEFIG